MLATMQLTTSFNGAPQAASVTGSSTYNSNGNYTVDFSQTVAGLYTFIVQVSALRSWERVPNLRLALRYG